MKKKELEKAIPGQDPEVLERLRAQRGILTAYQRPVVEDRSPAIIWEASRQIGKSFGITLKACLETSLASRPIESVYGSASARQVFRSGRQIRQHIKVLGIVTEGAITTERDNSWLFAFPGDRFLNLVPSNPDTIPGFSGNVYLDEFALHKDDWSIWRAAIPSVTRGFRIRVTSTHRGTKTKFYELCRNKKYSHYRTTIVDAFNQGLVIRDEEGNIRTIEDLRALVSDDMVWAEEYMLEPQDESTAWLPWSLIRGVEDESVDLEPEWSIRLVEEASQAYAYYKLNKHDPPDLESKLKELASILADGDDPIDFGMDIGRNRDFSVIWIVRRKALAKWTLAVIKLDRAAFRVQRKVLYSIIPYVLRSGGRGCIDRYGIGQQLHEEAQDKFGSRIEGINFTNANKEVLAVGLKDCMQDYGVLIPIDSDISTSLHSVKKMTTATGMARFDAERTDATGHADHFWALALAVHAGETSSINTVITSRRHREAMAMVENY